MWTNLTSPLAPLHFGEGKESVLLPSPPDSYRDGEGQGVRWIAAIED